MRESSPELAESTAGSSPQPNPLRAAQSAVIIGRFERLSAGSETRHRFAHYPFWICESRRSSASLYIPLHPSALLAARLIKRVDTRIFMFLPSPVRSTSRVLGIGGVGPITARIYDQAAHTASGGASRVTSKAHVGEPGPFQGRHFLPQVQGAHFWPLTAPGPWLAYIVGKAKTDAVHPR